MRRSQSRWEGRWRGAFQAAGGHREHGRGEARVGSELSSGVWSWDAERGPERSQTRVKDGR